MLELLERELATEALAVWERVSPFLLLEFGDES
jgi:hypothetical protein